MAKKQKKTIIVQGSEIALLPMLREEDYISLTDIMKTFDDEFSIYSWMRNKNTVEFLGVWEQLHNPTFKGNEFVTFKNQAGSNSFNLTPSKWIKATAAIGIRVKAGRYGGGTFAHKDIAINFCAWLSPTFQLYLIKEFQRLKEIEAKDKQEVLDWSLRRVLSKLNYKVQTDAIKERLIPARLNRQKAAGLVYASEADILNVALFGMTAKEWRIQNPDTKGNIRDTANIEQLVTLINLQ
ncbi:MAG: KilA-N domain-containing protein, partial [Bacteroidota bacterium]